MVWDDGLSVKEVTEMKKKTPRFPSRERNFAMRRRGPRRSSSLILGGASPIGVPPIEPQDAAEPDRHTYKDPQRCNRDCNVSVTCLVNLVHQRASSKGRRNVYGPSHEKEGLFEEPKNRVCQNLVKTYVTDLHGGTTPSLELG